MSFSCSFYSVGIFIILISKKIEYNEITGFTSFLLDRVHIYHALIVFRSHFKRYCIDYEDIQQFLKVFL